MSVERVLPKTIDYTDVLPLAVESKSRRRTFFPNNGATFSTTGNNIIRIDLSADALLDTQHSYLRFTMTTPAGAANTCGIDPAGGHAFISRLRVEQSGTILEDIQAYNKLLGSIILPCQASDEYSELRTLTEGQHAKYADTLGTDPIPVARAAAAGAGFVEAGFESLGLVTNGIDQVAGGGRRDFCIPLMSGLLNCEKLIPLMLMSAPLTIEMELASAAEATVFGAGGAPSHTISDVRYVANLVEVGSEVGQQLRMLQEMSGGVLTLTGQTYRHFSGACAAGNNNTINIPARVKSMKSVFFNMPGQNAAGGTGAAATDYDVGTGVHNNVDSYQFKIGSVTYPPTPVRCQFGTQEAVAAGTANVVAAETVMELEKAWGNVGSRFGLGSKAKAMAFYRIADIRAVPVVAGGQAVAVPAAINAERYAPFGLDMEAFQRVAIESGVNTADRALPISLILEHGGAGAIVSNIDVYVLADALFYINADGSMSVSV